MGLGGKCEMRKVQGDSYDDGDEKEDNFNLAHVLLSQGDFDSDDEFLANGTPNPYNVKFKVDIEDRDVFGIYRIFRELAPEKTAPYMKKKLDVIKAADEKRNRAIEAAQRQYKDKSEKMSKAQLDSLIDEANTTRDQTIEDAGYKSDTLYLSEKDRDALKLRNIIVFSPWRTPNQKRDKPRVIKAADGTRLKVRKKSHNKELFPEVYKLILGQVAAGLMEYGASIDVET